jgi:hypothetical protein
MKKIFFLLVLLTLTMSSCGKQETIQFCEGADKEGKGVHCGVEFETGELLAIIKPGTTFETNRLVVETIGKENGKIVASKKETITVKEDEKSAAVLLKLYTGGTYQVKVYKNKEVIASGSVKMVDIY